MSFEIIHKLVKGFDTLGHLREEDIEIGVTPKEEVYREDKVVLYRFLPSDDGFVSDRIPILIVYALVNRPYMVDLQEGRSLVANLLKLGLDIYLIDWGYPTRGDRFAPFLLGILGCTSAVRFSEIYHQLLSIDWSWDSPKVGGKPADK